MGCWNVTSLNNKDQEILLEIERHKMDVCAITETKKKGRGNTKYGNYILIYSGKDKHERAASGVGILLHERFENNISNTKYINDRILQLTVELTDRKATHIISVYAPDTTKPKEEINIFYEDLQAVLDGIGPRDEIIILGDLNARIGNEYVPGVKNRYNEETKNESGEQLIQLCAQNELRINNTFFPHKSQHKFTFENTRGQKSVIDYVITNRNIHPSRIQDVRTLTSANAGTNHGLVLAKLAVTLELKKSKSSTKSTNKINVESLSDASTRYLYQRRLEEKIQACEIQQLDDVETAWKKLKDNIIKAAEEALGRRSRKGDRNPNTKPWFTQEVKTLAEKKRKSYLQYRSTSITYNEYKRVRNRINSDIQAIKSAYWEKFSKDMERDLYGGQKKVWNMLRNRKKPINEFIQNTKNTIEDWEEHFQELYAADEGNTEHTFTQIDDKTHRPWSISREKIEQLASKLKNRKSPGADEISNEMIKYGGDILLDQIHVLFNKILDNMDIPTEWKHSITIPIHKKGAKTDPANYRGIGLLSTMSKLLTKIFQEEVAAAGTCEEQQGFRNNRSTIDAIFTIRQITEKAIEFNKAAFICFVDLTQAFDRVRLADVVPLLQKRKIHPTIITTIGKLNTNNYTSIRVADKLSKKIPIATGIRQGDSLSPTLFNLIMDEMITEVKKVGRGYRMGDKEIRVICYADDAVLISESEDDLQRLLYNFEQTASKFNMQISTSKTQCLVVAKEPRRCKLAIYNKSVEQVMNFKYLGANITSSRNLENEVKAQTVKASLISGYLRDIIWRNKYMSIESKTRIYKTCVRPIMTYAIETRAENAVTKRLLRTTEMRTLRCITGHSLRDRVRSHDIRTQCDIQDVVRWGRNRRREWRDHVDRMDDTRLPKIAKEGAPTSKRPPGRPPIRWHESWSSASQLQL